jgi:hypothetical protein
MPTSSVSRRSSTFAQRLTQTLQRPRADSRGAVPATPGTPVPEQEHLGFAPGERSYTMFVQTARAGTWAAKPGEEGTFTLTLTGLPAQTVYFSDRPERIVGTQPTSAFLDTLGFIESNPPNAALVTTADDGADDILVIELFNPVYSEGSGPEGATLVYDARVLENYQDTELGGVARLQDDAAIPASFAGASLFIDDCADGKVECSKTIDDVYRAYGQVSFGCCYSFPYCKTCSTITSAICDGIAECADGTCDWEYRAACSVF